MVLITSVLLILLNVLSIVLVALQGAHLRHTTLCSAWIWSLLAACAACISSFCSAGSLFSAWDADLAWYATAVLGLCPLIAVLGARRPGAGVWNWFVVLPLLAVLLWPATVAGFRSSLDGLRIDVPPLVGFTVVLVMGCGNYLGTRFWLPTVLYGFAEFLLAAPITEWGDTGFANSQLRGVAILCWPLAVILAWTIAQNRTQAPVGFDRAWLDFRDSYGMVWARRVQDRVNERAAQEQWCARLDVQGFHWDADVPEAERRKTAERIDHTLRWLLRRFVDDRWLDARLGTEPAGGTE
jgi:hypothetical protein